MRPVYFDATVPESYAAMVEAVTAQAGSIDILVNNFGIGKPREDLTLVDGSEAAFFQILELNVGSVYRVSKLVIPHMPAGGSIVNISSIGGLIPDTTRIGYGVSKAAVNNLTQQAALQYARRGIRCNAVLPGLTATDAALREHARDVYNILSLPCAAWPHGKAGGHGRCGPVLRLRRILLYHRAPFGCGRGLWTGHAAIRRAIFITPGPSAAKTCGRRVFF